MRVEWLGHSCFLITEKSGINIITDPFRTDKRFTYHQIDRPADIVTVSHQHYDHNFTDLIPGKFQVFNKAGTWTVRDVEIRSIDAWHDGENGKERGGNVIFCITVDGITLCHCGDLGHVLTQDLITALGKVDVLCIPVGGAFTLDLSQANQVCDAIKPKIIFPMHYKTEQCTWLPNSAEDFARDKKNVRKVDSGFIEINKESLPAQTEIVVLEYKAQGRQES